MDLKVNDIVQSWNNRQDEQIHQKLEIVNKIIKISEHN